jgi:hypothetical protein
MPRRRKSHATAAAVRKPRINVTRGGIEIGGQFNASRRKRQQQNGE